MALVTCPDCKKEISSRAASCPHCGAPMSAATIVTPQVHGAGEGIWLKSMNCGCVATLVVVGLIVLMLLLGHFQARRPY